MYIYFYVIYNIFKDSLQVTRWNCWNFQPIAAFWEGNGHLRSSRGLQRTYRHDYLECHHAWREAQRLCGVAWFFRKKKRDKKQLKRGNNLAKIAAKRE